MKFRASLLLATLVMLGAFAASAQSPRQKEQMRLKPSPPAPPPENVFSLSPDLPAHLRRVLALPLAAKGNRVELIQGRETLWPVLLAELGKTERFEVVTADADTLRRQTGRTDWTGAEILPADFFDSLQRTYGCDAILFCELTVYHPYPPEIIGWRLKLVDARTRQILWAVDKEFAADQAAVAQDARRYLAAQHPTALDTPDVREVWLMEHSPRRFAQFTAARVLATLPTRAAKSESNR